MDDPRLHAFIGNVVDGNAVDARKAIDDVMLDKIKSVVDARKVEITQNLVGGIENETEDEAEEEIEADSENTEVEDQEQTEVEPQEDSNGEEAESNTEEGGTDN